MKIPLVEPGRDYPAGTLAAAAWARGDTNYPGPEEGRRRAAELGEYWHLAPTESQLPHIGVITNRRRHGHEIINTLIRGQPGLGVRVLPPQLAPVGRVGAAVEGVPGALSRSVAGGIADIAATVGIGSAAGAALLVVGVVGAVGMVLYLVFRKRGGDSG